MKIPAAAIAAGFACGIVLGGSGAFAAHAAQRWFLAVVCASAFVLAHQDHIGGLTAVLQNFRVSRLWLGRETIEHCII